MIVKKSVEADYPPLMRRQRDALDDYAKTHGPDWKDRLRAEWADATAESLLHHFAPHTARTGSGISKFDDNIDVPDAYPLRDFVSEAQHSVAARIARMATTIY
jgi:hypothetical protein